MKLQLLSIVVVAGFTLNGCGKAPSVATPADAKAHTDEAFASKAAAGDTARKSASKERDPCSVLEVADVEAVIGTLAGAPFQTNGPNSLDPQSDGSACRYEAANFRSLGVDVAWSGGGKLQSMAAPAKNLADRRGMRGQLPKGAVPEGVEVAGDWDEADVVGCCRLNAYYADTMISVEFSESRATVEQVAGLVNKIISHIDKPVAIDGRAGVKAALQRMGQRPKVRSICELLTRADVEAVVGPLNEAPTGDASTCQYTLRPAPGGGDSVDRFKASADWTWGYSKFREVSAMHGAVTDSLLGPAKGISVPGLPPDKMKELEKLAASMGGNLDKMKSMGKDMTNPSQTGIPGPWDEAAFLTTDFVAVKKDVLLTLEGVDSTRAKALAAKAMEKL